MAAALTEAPVTVTVLVAVTLTCLLADEPTGVSPNCADPLRASAAPAVSPKPNTWPSLVPTYTMPLFVAATLNLLEVPIGAAQISLSFTPPPDRGTGSSCQAPRKALAPLPPLV